MRLHPAVPFAAAALAAMATIAALGACGTSKADSGSFPDPDVTGRTENPEGIPYPTTNLGGLARRGEFAGNTIPNFTFQGYVDSDRTRGLVPVSLADYYDPEAKHHKVLQILVAATWCTSCAAEMDALVKIAPTLGPEGAVFLIAVVEGPSPGTGPKLGELDAWIDKHGSTFTTVFDANARRLGTVQAQGVPWNALIDTRTMEILHSSTGAPDKVEAYVRLGLTFVNTHPR